MFCPNDGFALLIKSLHELVLQLSFFQMPAGVRWVASACSHHSDVVTLWLENLTS